MRGSDAGLRRLWGVALQASGPGIAKPGMPNAGGAPSRVARVFALEMAAGEAAETAVCAATTWMDRAAIKVTRGPVAGRA